MRFCVALLMSVLMISPLHAQKKSKAPTISFSKDVFPVIKKRCLPCHAADSENPSNLILESYGELITGGKNGKPIIPGKGDQSILVKKIKPDPPFGEQMPLMTKNKLSTEEVQLFKEWIDQGAKKN